MIFTFNIDTNNNIPTYIQIYNHIKNEITSGKMTFREKLPSVRRLSSYLGLSKTTIENAYQQLLAEGYIFSEPQKGYYVSKLEEGFFNNIYEEVLDKASDEFPEETFEFDFKEEYVENENFNFDIWKKYLNEIINYDKEKLYTYGFSQGESPLIKQIIKYIHRTRGVKAKEDHVVIGAGIQPLLSLLSVILKKEGYNQIAMEEPGFNRAKNVFEDNNLQLIPFEVSEYGIDLMSLKQNKVKLCYVSPSHQYPTGTIMLVDSRMKLIKWAHNNNGYIIEDDYNSELRYEGKPIPAMQGLDPHDRVIYLGSFSTVLVPSIRLSYMILPNTLMASYYKERHKYAQTASKLEQLALAKMMEKGDFERHIRKIKNRYSKKNEYTIKCIQKKLSDFVDIIDTNSGLNILLKLKIKVNEYELVQQLKKEGINISSLNEYRLKPQYNPYPILILNYRGIPYNKILDGLIGIEKVLSRFTICIEN